MTGVEHLTEHVDPTGWEEPCAVFLDPAHASDEGEILPASICISYKVDLSPAQAREVAARLVALAGIIEAHQ